MEILKPKINHAVINKKLKTFLIAEAKKKGIKESDSLFEYLEELPELCEKCRGDIFRWSDIPGKDAEVKRLKKFLIEKLRLNWVRDANCSQDTKNQIEITKGSQHLVLSLDPELEIIKCKTKEKIDFPNLVVRQEKGKYCIYQYEHEFSLDPNLPVDRIFKEPLSKKEFQYHVFFIASTKDIPESLEKALLFFKYYISRMIPSKMFDIQVVISENTKILDINSRFFKTNGIGLVKVENNSDNLITIIKPVGYKEYLNKRIEISGKREKTESIRECEYFIDNAIQAVVGVKSEQFGKSYIDRNLMNKMFELEKISFKDDLTQLINEHLTEKSDEYEFANEVFTQLWPEYIGPNYTDFLKIFEPSLQYIYAETRGKGDPIYRDHYLHQFQVFLLGLPIIDKYYDLFKTQSHPKPELSWLIAASFHDIAYPVQKFDYWSEDFFKQVFKLDRNPSILELKTNFIDEKFLACMNYLICSLSSNHLNRELTPYWADSENDFVQFFYRKITEEKNHGVMSSISLLKLIQSNVNRKKIEKKLGDYQTALKEVIVPGALAIALHDDKVWNANLYKKEKGKKYIQKDFLKSLKFQDDPLSFLMIFCDSVHEWGRPSKSEESAEENFGMKFYLKKFDCASDKVEITLWTPDCIKNHGFYTRKDKELKKIQNFLVQPSTITKIQFIIYLEDQDCDPDKYIMKGPSK